MKRLLLSLSLALAAWMPAQSQVITTYAGDGLHGYSGDGGPATSATVFFPFDLSTRYDGAGIAVDASGNVYFSDEDNSVVRMVNATTNIITTVVGYNPTPSGSGDSPLLGGGLAGDGGPATAATLTNPAGLTFSPSGDLYICDFDNFVIRKVDHTTNIISTVAGVTASAATTASGDGGPATAANIGAPMNIAFDAAGNFYFTDIYNNMVRKVTVSTGIISTVAGVLGGGASTADGAPATAETLNMPYGILTDAAGNIYVSELGANRVRIINSAGIISTFAGNGTAGTPDSNVVASSTFLSAPRGITWDAAGDMFISTGCYIVKVAKTTNILTFVAGTSTCGYSGDFGQANVAEISGADNMAVNAAGNLFFTDDWNMRVRKIGLTNSTTGSGIANTQATGNGMDISPNPASGAFSLRVSASTEQQVQVTITNITGQVIKELQIAANSPAEVTLSAAAGMYLVTATTTEGRYVGKLIIQ